MYFSLNQICVILESYSTRSCNLNTVKIQARVFGIIFVFFGGGGRKGKQKHMK